MPARKKRPAVSAKALATNPAQARTIVYVHGINNKPPADVLKLQWDRALFGFDLSDHSRMAYWVDRERYPLPLPATGDAADYADGNDPAPEGPGMRALASGDDLEECIRSLTEDSDEQASLRAMADALATDTADATVSAADVEAKVLPLPEGMRRWITRGITRALLRDVYDYFFVPERRAAMRESLLARLRPGGGPFVVVAHSQGSMIAYDVLSGLAPDEVDVALFVTIGSPLGITEAQDQIKRITRQKRLAVPRCVREWVNVSDRLDPVALDHGLAGEYAPAGSVEVRDELAANPDSPRHPHSATGYLRLPAVKAAVQAAVQTELFQPVADFTIARDVVRLMEQRGAAERHEILIELRDEQLARSRSAVEAKLRELAALAGVGPAVLAVQPLKRYVAARLTREETEWLASELGKHKGGAEAVVSHVWSNAVKRGLVDISAQTVQATPAHIGYHACGAGIHWAILDTGVFAGHPHFARHQNIVEQCDATGLGEIRDGAAPDGCGHGTHVAGIIAGEKEELPDPIGTLPVRMAGMAPWCKLHVYKVLNDDGSGRDASIIRVLDRIAETNERAAELAIHGINLSLGGPFDPGVFGCGHSPLCRELRRLWRQGVLVVIAAGNEGVARLQTEDGPIQANMDLSIGDPGNLDEAIVVGSVNKANPHTFGVSYFSSRGPTADGRQKPDVVAPGEKIFSCRHRLQPGPETKAALYVEMSGTSMAAPHVSGLLAAFLSARREFIGRPDDVKATLLDNCTDLKRDRNHQGSGLPNLVKMLVNT